MNIAILNHKKSLGLVGLTAVTLMTGPKNVYHHAMAFFTGAKEVVETLESDDQLLRVLSAQVEDSGKTIRKGDILVRQHENRAGEIQNALLKLRETTETARTRLTVLKPALETSKGLLVGAVQYTSADVEREATRLIALITDTTKQETARNQELKLEQANIATTKAQLDKARSQLTDLKGKVKEVELRLASARAGQETRRLVAGLGQDFQTSRTSGAAHTLSVLEDRLAEMEVEAAETTNTSESPAFIQWNVPTTTTTLELVNQLVPSTQPPTVTYTTTVPCTSHCAGQ